MPKFAGRRQKYQGSKVEEIIKNMGVEGWFWRKREYCGQNSLWRVVVTQLGTRLRT